MATRRLRPAIAGQTGEPARVVTRLRPSPAWMVWICLGIVYVVWGSTYLAIRVVDRTMPPLLTSGARFCLAGAIVYAVLAVRRGPSALSITRTQFVSCLLIGTLLVTGGNGFVMLGELHVPSGVAALIIAAVPLWVVVYRWVLGRERVAAVTLAGVAMGFGGVALLLLPGGGGHARPLSLVITCLAAPCWALGSYLSGRRPLPSDPFLTTAWQMMLGGAVTLVAAVARGELGDVRPSEFSGDSLLGFVYLIAIGSLVAFTAYVWLLQNAPISKVATYAYVNPVIAIFLGWLILSEQVTWPILAGAAIVVASVAAIVRKESG